MVSLIFFALRKLTARPAGRPSTALALLSALGVALAGAVVWGLVARLFHVQLSLIGVLIGAGVGYVVARFRPGHMPTIVAGVVIAILGCALGTFLAIVFTLLGEQISLGTIFSHLNVVFRGYPASVGGLGLVFWLIAGLVAFRVPWQTQRLAARRGPVPPPGYGAAGGSGYGAAGGSGYGAAGGSGYGAAGGYGTPAGYDPAAGSFGPPPASSWPDPGLPPFTDPGPTAPGTGPADRA